MTYHARKWGGAPEQWWQEINDYILYFASRRPYALRSSMNLLFGTGSSSQLTLAGKQHRAEAKSGSTALPRHYPGRDFISAIYPSGSRRFPDPGYRFARWTGSLTDTSADLTISVTSDNLLLALV